MDITPFFKLMADQDASDMFFSVGAPPTAKIQGLTKAIGHVRLTAGQLSAIVDSIINDSQRKEFEATMELNLALSIENVGRFRINVFRQRGDIALVVRYLRGTIPKLDALQLPALLTTLIMELRGLILVVGSTNSGKSTTLASMIDYRNEHHNGHILTIEDPIEYIHQHKKSIVDQREVGLDTLNYDNALKNALRESPDVILIGEIRDKETMKHAISYAETGHLCLSTLHANNANQAIDRIINFFPDEAKQQVLTDLSLNLRAIVSLRLIPGLLNKRVPVVEILINSPFIADLIEKGKIEEIKETMAKSREQGMQTFDQSLYDLYKENKISKDNAIRFADSKNNISLQMRLDESSSEPVTSTLTIQNHDQYNQL